MRDDQVGSRSPRRQEPRSITLIDLMALVAGSAFAMSLQELIDRSWIAAAQVTEPWATLLKAGEYASKVNIALVLVLVVRHVRFRTLFGPVEWLLIAIAMRSVQWRLAFGGGADLAARWMGWGSGGRFRAWYMVGIIGLVVVAVVLSAFRRTMPVWLKLPLLITLPLFALWGPARLVWDELDILWRMAWPSVPMAPLTRAAYSGLMQSPEHLIVCVPFVAALIDLRRRGLVAWTWQNWTGFGLALFLATAEFVTISAEMALNYPQLPLRLAKLGLSAECWLAEIAVAALIVRCFGGLWTRWIGPSRKEPGVT
jgi:hypothetical protein